MSITEQIYSEYLLSAGISTDTRNIQKNQVFFALKGEKFDAGEFVPKALEAGAKLVVTQDVRWEGMPGVIVTRDSLEELQKLASLHRDHLKIPVIGITGTNGKTTTKELIATVLQKKFRTAYTKGNLNNEIGVPLTILDIKQDDEMAIIEMGASHPGDIEFLCQIASPGFGIITNVGKAHLQGFGSFENVIKTKTELFRYIQFHHGLVFVNENDDILKKEAESNEKKWYGNNTFSIDLLQPDKNGFLRFDISFGNTRERIQTQLVGDYNLPNALAAAAIGTFFGIGASEIAEALRNYVPGNARSQFVKTSSNELIVDTYNANPSSVKAALDNFDSTKHARKAVILGSMLELGDYSHDEHLEVLKKLKTLNLSATVLIGQEFMEFREYFPGFIFFKNAVEAKDYLQINQIKDCLILLKGSRGIAVEQTIDVL